jgi:hypothetical protein
MRLNLEESSIRTSLICHRSFSNEDITMTSITDKLIELGIKPLDGEAFSPFTEEEVATIETTIGEPLPESYKRFLLRFGGSTFAANVSSAAPDERLRFGQFFRFSELLNAIGYLNETLPETIIPIGDNWSDIVFCLGVSRGDTGKVYFHNTHTGWQYDAEGYLERGEPVPVDIRYQVVQEISPSFEDFINHMEKEEDG